MGTIMLNGNAYNGGGSSNKFNENEFVVENNVVSLKDVDADSLGGRSAESILEDINKMKDITPFNIKGKADTVDDLPLIADEGDLYFVGTESDENSDEYVYTADGKWELVGNTEVDLSGYVKTSDMADVYGIETNTVPTIESKVEENRVTLGYSGKNLFENKATSQTVNGVTFVVNSDKSVTVNGAATALTTIELSGNKIDTTKIIPGQKYILTGCPEGGNITTSYALYISLKSDQSTVAYVDDGNSAVFTMPSNPTEIRILVRKDATVNNLTFKPMIRPASITDDTYEPYKPSVDERLSKCESMSVHIVNDEILNYAKTLPARSFERVFVASKRETGYEGNTFYDIYVMEKATTIRIVAVAAATYHIGAIQCF